MRRVGSFFFWIFFGLSCGVCMLLALALFLVVWPFDPDRRLNHLFSCAWASMYAYAHPGLQIRVVGRERIARGVPYVIVANHASVADIVLAYMLFRQFKWVSKASMFQVPVLGWNMRLCRYIPLVRGNKASIVEMMERCRYWLARGISILMFPEGTRSQDGELKAFKPGAFALARQMGVSVVPVAIHGGHALIPKHGASFALEARLLVEVLEPMTSSGYDSDEAYGEAVRGRIAAALASMPARRSGARARTGAAESRAMK